MVIENSYEAEVSDGESETRFNDRMRWPSDNEVSIFNQNYDLDGMANQVLRYIESRSEEES